MVPRGLHAAHRALTRALPSRLEGKRSTALVQKLTTPKARPPRAHFATPVSRVASRAVGAARGAAPWPWVPAPAPVYAYLTTAHLTLARNAASQPVLRSSSLGLRCSAV